MSVGSHFCRASLPLPAAGVPRRSLAVVHHSGLCSHGYIASSSSLPGCHVSLCLSSNKVFVIGLGLTQIIQDKLLSKSYTDHIFCHIRYFSQVLGTGLCLYFGVRHSASYGGKRSECLLGNTCFDVGNMVTACFKIHKTSRQV